MTACCRGWSWGLLTRTAGGERERGGRGGRAPAEFPASTPPFPFLPSFSYINNHLMFKVLVHRQTAALLRRKRAAAADAALAAVEAGVRRLLADAGDERADDDSFMIVGFEVLACSIARSPGDPITDTPCADGGGAMPPPQLVAPGARVAYTYDVFWEESAITWATRWDAYLRAPGGAGSVHWLSILNSLAVVLVTSSLVAWIMARTVRRDLARYEAVLGGEGDKDGGDDGGWKAVAGDAFRPPPGAATLAARVGAGVQILAATAATLAAAAAGFLSPASRGALVTGLLAAYIALAAAAGYAGVRVWARMQRGAAGWPAVAWRAAAHYPALALAVLAALNVLLARSGSSGAIPAAAFFSVAALYLAVSIPLAFAGGAAAARAPPPDPPTRTNQIPRRVPPARWASSGPALFAAAGLLPFGTLLVELHFAMASLWRGYFYYVVGGREGGVEGRRESPHNPTALPPSSTSLASPPPSPSSSSSSSPKCRSSPRTCSCAGRTTGGGGRRLRAAARSRPTSRSTPSPFSSPPCTPWPTPRPSCSTWRTPGSPCGACTSRAAPSASSRRPRLCARSLRPSNRSEWVGGGAGSAFRVCVRGAAFDRAGGA